MDEYQQRVGIAALDAALVVTNLVHQLKPFERVLLRNTNVLLLERHGAVGMIEEEATPVGYPEECGDILVIGQCGTQPHQPDGFVAALDLTEGAGYNGLQYGSTIVVEEVDLVDDHQFHQLRVRPPLTLAGDNVPFLGSGDQDLGISNLLA
mmetsp:Transcript_54352/g.65401  ORF Transcript_54352/g.65401 Transcript_54352/m.65401 type:complete len:151 (-) Transcript_54352:756-1208(-)